MSYHCRNKEDQTIDSLLGFPNAGFYIDVGAHSPHHESATKSFYERGWHGINIEPQARYFNQLQSERTRDTNLNVACGSYAGELNLYLSGVSGELTTAVVEFARTDWIQVKVPVMTLTQICNIFLKSKSNSIDFLKIDVEGYEKSVLQGMNFAQYRPKLLCIEATQPNTTIPNFEHWEQLVLNANYSIVKHHDQHNRYYFRNDALQDNRSNRAARRSWPNARIVRKDSVSERANVGRAYYDRAKVCALRGDVSGAVLAYETAVLFAPDFAEAYSNLGNLYLQSGRRDDALLAYATAIRAKPDLAPVYCNLANILIDFGRCDEAVAASETALRLAPDLYEAHVNLCRAYRRSGRDREALAPALRAAELRPDLVDYVNLGVAACNLEAFDIAFDAYRRALELDKTFALTYLNLGLLYYMTGRYAEAIAASETAIALRPDFAMAHVNLGHSLLVCGDFARGWDELVWMWRVPIQRATYPYLDHVTRWNGEPFPGRQLLVTLNHGFGDAIQMVRYLPAIKARGGRVILEGKTALVQLFADLPGVDELRVLSDGAILADDVDLVVPSLELPRALATDLTSIPAPIPYLRAQPERVERWRPRLESPARLRVGILWAGSPDHDRHRSWCRLEDISALGAIDGIAWFGLQKGHDEERQSCGSLTLDPLGAEIGDFADTAAILTHLDLVIATDTAIVHLAGAMGKPVWTLLAFAPDWRWLLGRGDSPWYPTMRLFRQPTTGDWASVFAEVAHELRTMQSLRRCSVRHRWSARRV